MQMRVCNANAQIATFKSVNASPGTPPEPGGSHAGLRLPHGAEASTGRCQVSIDQTTLLGLRKSPQAGLCRYPLEGSGRAGPAEQTTARRNLAIQAPANILVLLFGILDFFFCSVEGLVPSSLSDTILGAKSRIQNNL